MPGERSAPPPAQDHVSSPVAHGVTDSPGSRRCFLVVPAQARIAHINTSDAAALPGVRAVLTAEDLNRGVHERWHTLLGPDSPETQRPPLPQRRRASLEIRMRWS